jgi:hypothetical protein
MKDQRNNVDADRLFEAAEAVILALTELAARGSPTLGLNDVVGTPAEPKCLWDYTREEVQEATAFLWRMGFLTGGVAA